MNKLKTRKMVQLKKKAVLLIGALMLLLGMGMNLQYALDDYGWADNLAVQVLAAVTGDFDTTIYPGQPVEPGKVRDQVPCMYTYPDSSFTSSVAWVCVDQYVCPSCNCTPVPCGGMP